MNLSSMMYRLNVQQQQQQSSQPQQQQSQQSTSQQQQQQHTTQAIPSHILLQQQLNAAAAAAAAATAGSATGGSSSSAGQPTAITLHVSDVAGELNGSASSSSQQHQQHHHQQQPQPPQQPQQQHSHHVAHVTQRAHGATATTTTIPNASNTIAIVSNTALVPITNVLASSVEEKIKIISTALKAEPLQRDIIALTALAKGNNSSSSSSSSSSGNKTNHKHNKHSNMSNNSSGSSASGNIIALTINTPAASVAAQSAGAGATIKLTAAAASAAGTSLAAAAAAAGGSGGCTPTAIAVQHLNAVNSLNLVVGAAAAGSSAAATPGALVITTGTGTAVSVGVGGGGSSTGSSANGHLVFVPSKRARLEGPPDEWLSTTPSPGSVPSSAPPLSPSPGSQNHSYSANMSNGYASPMSAGSYDPYSPNGKTGRDDLSPSSSLNGYSANEGCDVKKIKKGPAPRLQEELCLVCGDRASGYHYNALTCEGCKGFFRRSVTKNAVYCCKFGRACEMDMYMRRKCQECRLKKCLAVGMRPECVVPENQCAMKRREKKAQKEKDKQQASPLVSTTESIKKEIVELMTCDPPTHPTCPLLPDDIVAKCRARNIAPLTQNQLAVIYKLIWYQDGYEQPSEEDLKRIMSSPDENESQHDISFRHITEITILTVQLIVEFAKGLPAFTKIPQEDQITLLKACSSEVMMLRMARRYDHNSDSIFFANNRSYTRDAYKMAGVADNIEDLLHFCRQMFSMKVDNVEYALLTAIVIFSDRPGLEQAELVEAIQSYYIDTLRIYILNRHCGDPMSLVFFAKLLSILTELRTLGNQNAEMCFSLKLKNRKLPKFLEEIWDVHAVPPVVQSHIQATQAERESAEAVTSATASASSTAPSPSTSAAAVDAAYSSSPSATPVTGLGGGVGVSVAAGLNGGVTTGAVYGGAPGMSMINMPLKQEHIMGVQLKQEHLMGGDGNTAA